MRKWLARALTVSVDCPRAESGPLEAPAPAPAGRVRFGISRGGGGGSRDGGAGVLGSGDRVSGWGTSRDCVLYTALDVLPVPKIFPGLAKGGDSVDW